MGDTAIEPTFAAYQPENLAEVLEFVGECSRLSHFASFHPGDTAHWMSSYYKGHDLGEHFGLYRDANRELAAINSFSNPQNPSFELIVHPRYLGSPLELDLLAATEKHALERIQAAGLTDKKPITTVAGDDTVRIQFLEARGYQKEAGSLNVFNERCLNDPIPEPALPPGYVIRSVAGEQEVGQVVAVHNSSFTPKWTESLYLETMRTPGFDINREMVVVAPDATFAAFLVYWPDPVSGSGLFEPVGCHKNFQRKGLTKALMYAGMQRMKAAGLQTALVLYYASNPASKALYTSVGFQPIHEFYEFSATR